MQKLGIGNNSPRKKDEEFNIEIKEASVLRLKVEPDNDIHITICEWADENTPINIMTIEVSGLPDRESGSFEALAAARKQFYAEFPFFVSRKYASYKSRSKAPKITVIGSLFFDHYHSKENQNEEYNKTSQRVSTSFELHPITQIKRID
jgi:hypothetical protein